MIRAGFEVRLIFKGREGHEHPSTPHKEKAHELRSGCLLLLVSRETTRHPERREHLLRPQSKDAPDATWAIVSRAHDQRWSSFRGQGSAPRCYVTQGVFSLLCVEQSRSSTAQLILKNIREASLDPLALDGAGRLTRYGNDCLEHNTKIGCKCSPGCIIQFDRQLSRQDISDVPLFPVITR